MKNLPFDTVNLSADDVQAMEDSYNALKAKFNIGLPEHGFINNFELFNNEQEASVNGTFLINYPSPDCYLNFVKIHYHYNAGRSTVDNYRCQCWLFVKLKEDGGRILIRKETFADRVLEVVHHTELKFSEDKIFSNNFYVNTNDTEKALSVLTGDFRTIIKENMYTNFIIEVVKDTLVIRNNQPIEVEQTVHMVELATKLAAI